MKPLMLTLLFAAMIGFASASTVTLTGTCYSNLINKTNNYMQFNISNSGNGTATNLLLEPEIEGASPVNSSILIPLVAPGGSYSERIFLTNFTMPGSYVERFAARYSQGSSSFITLFPCLVNIGRNAHSLLGIEGLSRKNNNIQINISSIAPYAINAKISVYVPPSFTVSKPIQNLTIRQNSLSNITFAITTPQYSNAEFPIVIDVSYINNSVHYAALGITTIAFGSNASVFASIAQGDLLLYLIGIIIAIIIILIITSVFHKRRKKTIPSAQSDTSNRQESTDLKE